jgi:hypothetical protein
LLPAPGDLSWEASEHNGIVIQRLNGLNAPVVQAKASPNGRWWALALRTESFYGDSINALILMDSQSDHHCTATDGNYESYQSYLWLPDNRLLWIESGGLYLADADGRNLRQIDAPEPIIELALISGLRVFAGGEANLWRLDLADDRWDPVLGIDSDNPRPPASSPSSRLTVAQDGSYAMLLNLGEVWRIPAEDGEPAVWLNAYAYPGRDGRIAPLLSLADSPFWIIQQQPLCSQGGALIDSRDGQIITFAEFLNGAADSKAVPASSSPTGFRKLFGGGPCFHIQPILEGRWLTSVFSHDIVVLSSDPSIVVPLPDPPVLGWTSDPDGIFVSKRTNLGRPLSWMSLPSGDSELLWPDLDPYHFIEFASTARRDYLIGLQDTRLIVIRLVANMQSEILVDYPLDLTSPFEPDGEFRFFDSVESNGDDGILVTLYEESGQGVLLIREQ